MNPLYLTIFFIIAALYSSVGLGGGTAYLAFLSFLDIPYTKIPATALFLNILCVVISFYNYKKAGHFRLRMLLPFAIASLPAVFIGSLIPVPEKVFFTILGISLFFVAVRMFLLHSFSKPSFSPSASMFWIIGLVSGVMIGLLSGVVGIGGGVFLTPLLMFLGWAKPKEAAALSSAFILLNSMVGFFGHALKGRVDLILCLLPGLAVIFGSYTGSFLGAKKLSPAIVQRIFAILLIFVVWKLIVRAL